MLRRCVKASAKQPKIVRVSRRPYTTYFRSVVQGPDNPGNTGDNKTGHIATNPNEGILYFTNLSPVNLPFVFLIDWLRPKDAPILHRTPRSYERPVTLPESILTEVAESGKFGTSSCQTVEVLPRVKEGGAFLKFSYDDQTDPSTVAEAVREHLTVNQIRHWWLGSVRAELVLGKPWVEDLFRLPSRRLRVEFLPTQPGSEAAEQNQEQLYAFFRPYGKLTDIVTQPSDSKIVPRYAYLDFARVAQAIMAKNCMHGYSVPESQGGGRSGTVLRLTYEKRAQAKWLRDWIFNHPRIVIPLIAALIAGISIAIFDPIRTLSIRAHITRTFHLEDNVVFRWFKTQGEDLINKVRQFGQDNIASEAGMKVVWDDRKADIAQIQSWLMESADTFIVVQGPRGSGKKELVVDQALRFQRKARRVLVVDCKPVEEARGDAATIAAAAAQVGYWPVFSWMNNFSGLMDLAAQGLTGVKAGFSETLETQISKVFNNSAAALKSIALEGRKKSDSDAKLSDDEYLEAHPERRPIVVLDNFLHKSGDPGASLIYDKVAEWAARLTTSNIAHVIFLTNDVSISKSLSKALPDRVFRTISLGDCSPEVAKRYVINHLDFSLSYDDKERKLTRADGEDARQLTPSQKRKDLHELDDVIPLLGGRLTDLEFLARRIKAGETPSKAVNEIIDQSSSEILKMFLLIGSEQKDWTAQQAWSLIRSLSARDSLRFNEVLLLDAYKTNGEKAVSALEQAELISVQSLNGRPYSIRPGRPVYQSAFRRLVEDKVLAAKMDLALISEAIGNENKAVDQFEQELHLLGKLPKQPGELRSRIQWLLSKIAGSQSKIEDYEKQSAGLKQVLLTEF